MARRATAQDVADLAGVSRSAVSLVLNGRAAGNIGPEKQKAVLAAAKQLRYTPNAVALSLRSQRTRTLGVLTWPGRAGLPQVMLHRALHRASEHGYLLLVMDTDNDRDVEHHQLETLRDRQVDGFLVVAPELVHYRPVEALLSTPTVLLNCLDPDGMVSSAVPDELEAGRRAVEVLLQQRHQRIGLLISDTSTLQTRLRVAGVQQALRQGGVAVVEPVSVDRAIDAGFHGARRLLLEGVRPTALICAHERLAVGATLAAASLGLPVPGALSVVSLEDGEKLASSVVPALTTVHRRDRVMTEQAVSLLVDQLREDSAGGVKRLLFSCPLRDRGSVAAAAS
ncbi:MAG: LacI family DNA-binding transcriptional regulator [Friedmanniella sp.]